MLDVFSPRPARLRTETSYEADDSRPVAERPNAFQRAADREAEPEERAEVDEELGQGQITTPYLGRSQSVPVSRACPKGGADVVTHAVR